MRSSAKSDPKRKRGVSIEAIRLRKRARMLLRMVEYLERADEVEDYDTEGSVIGQGGQEAEVIGLWDGDSDVSVSTPTLRWNISLRQDEHEVEDEIDDFDGIEEIEDEFDGIEDIQDIIEDNHNGPLPELSRAFADLVTPSYLTSGIR